MTSPEQLLSKVEKIKEELSQVCFNSHGIEVDVRLYDAFEIIRNVHTSMGHRANQAESKKAS